MHVRIDGLVIGNNVTFVECFQQKLFYLDRQFLVVKRYFRCVVYRFCTECVLIFDSGGRKIEKLSNSKFTTFPEIFPYDGQQIKNWKRQNREINQSNCDVECGEHGEQSTILEKWRVARFVAKIKSCKTNLFYRRKLKFTATTKKTHFSKTPCFTM